MRATPDQESPRPNRVWRDLVRVGVLLACLAGTAAGQEPPDEPSARDPAILERVRSILGDLRGDPPLAPGDASRRLAGFGPAIAPHLLAVRDEFPDAVHVAVIADALAGLKSDKLEGYLVWVVSGSSSEPSRIVAYVKLREHGGAFALPHLLRLMAKNAPKEKRPAERALSAILARNETAAAYATVGEFLRRAEEAVRFRILGAIADAGSVRGLPILADLIGMSDDLDLVIVSGIARLPVKAANEEVVEKLRSLLDSENTNLRRECALALGVFKVGDAVSALIDLLGDSDRGVRSNAHWSLRSISGQNFPPDPQAWRFWFAEEQEWWKTEGQRYLELLGSREEMGVLGAIAMLAGRPLFRKQVAPHLEALLESDSEKVREAARSALAGERPGSSGAGEGGGGRSVLAGGKIVRPPAARVGDLEEVGDVEPSTSWVFYVVIGGFIILFSLYVFGVFHPDRIVALLKRSSRSS